MWAGNRQSSIQHAPGGAGGEDDVFDELIDKAGAGTEDAGIDKTSG